MDKQVTPLQIGFRLAPEAPAQTSITRIELTISSDDLSEPLFLPITNINNEARSASGLIQVPFMENVAFSVKAFEGSCPVLSGLLENIDIVSDMSIPIVINLSPVQTIIGIRSVQSEINNGSIYSADVYIEDAPELLGFTCELEFDERLIEPIEVMPGDFFGNSELFIQDSELPRREENRLAMGITLNRDDAGVCGSGAIFQVTFRATGSGETIVEIVDNLTLIGTDFEPIESTIQIKSGSIVKIQ